MTATLSALWNAFDAYPDDMGRLLIIADAYAEDSDENASDCLRWCYENGRKPIENRTWEWCTSKGYGIIPWSEQSFDNCSSLPKEIEYCMILISNINQYAAGHELISKSYQYLADVWKELTPADRPALSVTAR